MASQLYGVYPEAKLHSVRVLDAFGRGSTLSILQGLDDVISTVSQAGWQLPSVATLSLGEPLGLGTLVDLFVEELISYNVVVTVSAGNDASNACKNSPAAAHGA